MTQTSTNPSGQGYTVTDLYNGTTGVLTGLSNQKNGTTPNLASLIFNQNALVASVNFQTSAGTPLAQDQFSYDGDLRPTEANAQWQSGSGSSGQIFDETRSYDPASNVISETTTQAQVSGSGGGSETQVYCYDEQNRLVWAGNSGSEPAPGNGTCGTAPLGNTLSGASYSNAFSYSYLDQFVQAPYNGTGTNQYLYCTSATPHQLTGVYAAGSTCASKSGKVYATTYDAWGNVSTRTLGSGGSADTATLSYDLLNHFIEWNDQTPGNQSQAWYAYDAGGNRVLQRATTGGATTITVYAFGMEEHLYDGSGNLQGSTYYYSLGGRLIGELTASGTNMLLTDPLGSVLVSFSSQAGSAAVQANRVYGPTGTVPYKAGAFSTNKGFTGQYHDPTTQLDYYGARYYDAKVGLFLSADSVQGMNPYLYVGGNPETFTDPTGNYYSTPGGITQHGGETAYVMPGDTVFVTVTNDDSAAFWTLDGQYHHIHGSLSVVTFSRHQEDVYGSYNSLTDPENTPLAKLKRVTGLDALQQSWGDPNATWQDKGMALLHFMETNANNLLQLGMIVGGPEGGEVGAIEEGTTTAIEEGATLAEEEGNTVIQKVVGRGTLFSHFTDASGVEGITGVDSSTLEVGQTVTVNELRFGQGANSFLAEEAEDIFVTELGPDATSRQLAQIGVLGEKQSFVIQFSQEAAVMNDIIPRAAIAARSIFTIPGGSVLSGFDFLVTRLQ